MDGGRSTATHTCIGELVPKNATCIAFGVRRQKYRQRALGGAEAAILELGNDGSDQRFADGFRTTLEIAELLGNFFLERDVLFAQKMFPLLPNYSFVNPTVHQIEQ